MYENISQRAASSYRKLLAEYSPSGGTDEQTRIAQRDLHAFFKTLYENLYQHPQAFGLPVGEDLCVAEGEPNEKDKKQAVKQKLNKPRGMIGQGLDFLMLAGIQGQLENQDLILEDFPAAAKASGIGPKFLQGLASSGLRIALSGARSVLSSREYPAMMAALKTLALGCAEHESERMGKFHFARCDFKAGTPAYDPDVLELYRAFGPVDYSHVAQLHAFFSAKGYKTSLEIGRSFAWVVKYQGNRKIKATPLFQVEYEERYADPLRLSIKCASTNRIADLLPNQAQSLQDDFMGRANPCRGDECGWCRNQKTLGPALVEYKGESKLLCWYTNPNIHGIDESKVELIQQYARLHDQLLPEN